MLRHILTATLVLFLSVTAMGCAEMLDQQAAKDRDLGQMVNENLGTGQFRTNFVRFTYNGGPGLYKCTTKDLADAKSAGDFAYNIMVVLIERNDTKVKTGRDRFVITGVQDGTEIFEVTFAIGTAPTVVLKGPFEGEVYTPSIRGQR